MMAIRGSTGAALILVATWCLTPAAQENEIDVVRELLSRFESIDARLKTLEKQFLELRDEYDQLQKEVHGSKSPSSVGPGEGMDAERLKAIEYHLVADSKIYSGDIALYLLYQETVLAGSTIYQFVNPGDKVNETIDLNNLSVGSGKCHEIVFRLVNRGSSQAGPASFDLEIKGKTVDEQSIMLIPRGRYELRPAFPKQLNIAPVLCDAWTQKQI